MAIVKFETQNQKSRNHLRLRDKLVAGAGFIQETTITMQV